MTLQSTAQVVVAGAFTTPAPITPQTSETFTESCFGPQGLRLRIITTGTLSNVAVVDPGVTPSSNPGTFTPLATPATGTRELLVPRSAINPASGVATVTFSSITGLQYEAYRY